MRIVHLLNPRYVWRSAITGKFVSRWFALMNPSTTYKDRL